MIKRYSIENHQLVPAEAQTAPVWVVVNPNEDERKRLVEDLKLDEHNFSSALDPGEPTRLEFKPDHLELILKRPKNYSSRDQFLFKVASLGLFLFEDKLILVLSEDINLFSGKYFKQVGGIREVFLKLIYNSVFHFSEHLKVIGMIEDELENKIGSSMEKRHLMNLFTLEKSLIYYRDATNANAQVIARLGLDAGKTGLSPRSLEFLEDITIDNDQCRRQAELCSGILAGLTTARAAMAANKLNVLVRNLNAAVLAIAVPGFLAGVGGMSELTAVTHIPDRRIAYPVFILAMALTGALTFWAIKRFEKH